jgi:hypothetical protein
MKKNRKVHKLTYKMAASWWGITSSAMYQLPKEKREMIMRQFKAVVSSGAVPDPRL